jgi:hypothetical protein
VSRHPTAPPADDRQSGQVVVLTLVVLAVLLGMSAAVLDVGSWYRADRALQSTVDASALAGGQTLPEDPPLASSLALEYAEKNGGGVESVSIETELNADDTILVTGSRPAPAFFTKLFGIAAPFGVDEQHPKLQCRCFDEPTDLQLEKVGPGAFRLLNVDGSHGGTGRRFSPTGSSAATRASCRSGGTTPTPAPKFNSSHVKDALDHRRDTEMLFPVYRNTRGGGANFEYEVVGWAGYVITGYEIQGSKNNKLLGYFTSVVWEGIGSETAGAPDFGAHALSLVE